MKNKTTAILLALFLGGLGIHHFYLEHYGRGILYLLFCWTGIPAILGVVDALIYAFGEGAEFKVPIAPVRGTPHAEPAAPVTPEPPVLPRQNSAPSALQQPQNSFTVVGAEVAEPEDVEQKQEEEVAL